jgi:hypothetical protein
LPKFVPTGCSALTLASMFNHPSVKPMATSPLHSSSASRSNLPPLPSRSLPWTAAEKSLCAIATVLAVLAVLGALFASELSALAATLGLQLNAHGHTHVYAHGHPFVDARVLWGIPNAMDVLSNLPFVLLGAYGIGLLYKAHALPAATRISATVFFVGLMLTCASSSFYHWAPDAWGLAIDRAGMAFAFAGVLGLASAERVSLRAAPWVWGSVLVAALLAIGLNYAMGAIAPWAVVQFGGMAVVLWAASQRALPGSLGIRWGVLIALYGLAKLLELGDAWVYHSTGDSVSGHSLKHITASLAALPVICALRHNAQVI